MLKTIYPTKTMFFGGGGGGGYIKMLVVPNSVYLVIYHKKLPFEPEHKKENDLGIQQRRRSAQSD